ncbi:HNH endonuclease signature motif containing protein [Sinomonas mesophila]|uniref:HNH endonuclease signature motif containing protein n=1 Tax=Sinomonas mesophila TaxID=1531955 RepID=UPI0015887483|nr:HNH endonuclease signature motif containing protein [Sinomonas mesophila]
MTGTGTAVDARPETLPAFTSRDAAVLRGSLWIDPDTLAGPGGTARALKALADFDAYTAALRAFLVNLLGQQIADEPLEGRQGQPTRLGGDLGHAVTVSEVALLQGTSEAAAARTVNFSDALVAVHPAVHEALLSGDITEAHAKVIVEQASTLPEEAAEPFGLEALARLRTRRGHLRTPGELRAIVRALRERLHPESITKRRIRAQADRGVWFQAEDDGMCTLTALLPAEIGLAAYQRIDAIAHAAHGKDGEARTTPQLRADALAQALLTDAPAGPNDGPQATLVEAVYPTPVPVPEGLADLVRAEIVVHLPAAVLLGASDDAAELEGYGVIDAQTARELAAAAPTWQRIWTDADGVPVRLGRTAYRPPEPLRRFIRYRDGVCLVPGCTCAARRAEIDHTIEWQDGGPTDADNLTLLCPKHHALKSLALFTLRRKAEQEGADPSAPISGELLWRTLLGFEHPAEPLDRSHILGPLRESIPDPRAPEPDTPEPSTPEPSTVDPAPEPTIPSPPPDPTDHEPPRREEPAPPQPPPF